MKTATIFAIGVLIPASLLADVGVSITLSGDNFHLSFEGRDDGCYDDYCEEVEYRMDGDPWFEDCRDDGYTKVSIEYQWTVREKRRVLVRRRVRFNTITHAWVFGPWIVEKHVHHHHYNPPVRSRRWKRYRRYDGGKVTYYYEYRRPSYRRGRHARVYRYEYRPHERRYRSHPRHESRYYEYRNNSHRRDNDHKVYKNKKHRRFKRYRKSDEKKYEMKKYHKRKHCKPGLKKSRNNREMTIVSGREYIR
ncbi:MAG: hypothetical protein ACLFQB_14580 [Chitinispirillaceae bacterium]